MSLKSSSTRYGSVAIAIHWTSAVAVILAFAAGFFADKADPVPVPLMTAHIVLGLSVFALTLLRLLWWLADRRPPPTASQPTWQRLLAQTVHGLFYVILILMGTSGIVTVVASGTIPALLSGGPVPDFTGLIPRVAHGVMSKILLALFVLHVGAAVYHQFVRRDHLLARMGLGRV